MNISYKSKQRKIISSDKNVEAEDAEVVSAEQEEQLKKEQLEMLDNQHLLGRFE